MPKAIATLDPTFVACMEWLRSTAERQAQFLDQFRVLQPNAPIEEWNGDWTDRQETAQLFDRGKLEEQIGKIVQTPSEQGTVSDMMLIATQSDVLASMQRAVTSRHLSYVQADACSFARRRGHGHPRGIWTGQWVAPMEIVDKAGKNEQR